MNENITGYLFETPQLLEQALTHPSASGNTNYQRLEYLGDSVLGMVIAEYLYINYPRYTDGQLSVIKNELVKRDTLDKLGRVIGLPAMIRFGPGVIAKNGPQNPSIIEDVFEAVVGAIYLDSSLEVVKGWILNLFTTHLSELFDYQFAVNQSNNPIQQLQMLTQKLYKKTATYSVIKKEGPDHAPLFTIKATIEQLSVEGCGKSKQKGMEVAARALLEKLQQK